MLQVAWYEKKIYKAKSKAALIGIFRTEPHNPLDTGIKDTVEYTETKPWYIAHWSIITYFVFLFVSTTVAIGNKWGLHHHHHHNYHRAHILSAHHPLLTQQHQQQLTRGGFSFFNILMAVAPSGWKERGGPLFWITTPTLADTMKMAGIVASTLRRRTFKQKHSADAKYQFIDPSHIALSPGGSRSPSRSPSFCKIQALQQQPDKEQGLRAPKAAKLHYEDFWPECLNPMEQSIRLAQFDSFE